MLFSSFLLLLLLFLLLLCRSIRSVLHFHVFFFFTRRGGPTTAHSFCSISIYLSIYLSLSVRVCIYVYPALSVPRGRGGVKKGICLTALRRFFFLFPLSLGFYNLKGNFFFSGISSLENPPTQEKRNAHKTRTRCYSHTHTHTHTHTQRRVRARESENAKNEDSLENAVRILYVI